MTDKETFIARVQAALTFMIVGAYIGLLIASRFGLDVGVADKLSELAMLAATFWLLRQRPNGASTDREPPTHISTTTQGGAGNASPSPH